MALVTCSDDRDEGQKTTPIAMKSASRQSGRTDCSSRLGCAISRHFTWWPTAGDGYLLPVLASVFIGGTPTWGGVGTVVGGAISALTVSFIQTGVVAAGLSSGFYVRFSSTG